MTLPRLSDDQADAIVTAAQNSRERAILMLLRRTGIRVSELTGLRVRDVHIGEGTITIEHLKRKVRVKCPACAAQLARRHKFCPGCGGKVVGGERQQLQEHRTRDIAVDKGTLRAVGDYTREVGLTPDSWLFSGYNGKPLHRFNINVLVRQAAARALEIPEKGTHAKLLKAPDMKRTHYVSPHAFRAALISRALQRDDTPEGLKRVQVYVGHVQSNTTMRYVRLLEDQGKFVEELWRTP